MSHHHLASLHAQPLHGRPLRRNAIHGADVSPLNYSILLPLHGRPLRRIFRLQVSRMCCTLSNLDRCNRCLAELHLYRCLELKQSARAHASGSLEPPSPTPLNLSLLMRVVVADRFFSPCTCRNLDELSAQVPTDDLATLREEFEEEASARVNVDDLRAEVAYV